MGGRSSTIDNEMVAYEAAGTGPTVVLVHGWSCDRSYWRNQRVLSDRFRVVSIDLVGHGEASTGRREWTMTAFGGDVVAVLDDLAVGEAVLVGHSMGGNVCLEAARRLGDRVRGVVWVDTYARLDVQSSAGSVAAFVAPFETDFEPTARRFVAEMFVPGEDPEIAEWVVADMSSAPPRVAVATIHASFSYGRHAHRLLEDVEAPIVAINTDYLGADIASLERHGVKVRQIQGTGHFPMLTAPGLFNRILEGIIKPWLMSQPG